jgi:2-polyprenyl-3-methyl-5-hydroxy-6-metoxy-1,4-benzoquinol methylase
MSPDDAAALRYSAQRPELAPFIPSSPGRVLDIGCGTGGFGSTLRRSGAVGEMWGVEPVPEAAEQARTVYDEVRTGFFPDASLGLPAAGFDTVFMLDVLEHLVEPAEALAAVLPLLAEDGQVIASIPNVRHFSVWWPLVRHGTWTYTETGLLDRTHLRWFTSATMRELFETSGYRVVGLEPVNVSEPEGWKARLLARLPGQREEMFAIQFVVTARPAPGQPTSVV